MKLHIDRTRRWINALREGTYRQIRKDYINDLGVCAMGVATLELGLTEFEYERVCLSYGIAGNRVSAVVHANDRDDKTFPEIADMIEGWLISDHPDLITLVALDVPPTPAHLLHASIS